MDINRQPHHAIFQEISDQLSRKAKQLLNRALNVPDSISSLSVEAIVDCLIDSAVARVSALDAEVSEQMSTATVASEQSNLTLETLVEAIEHVSPPLYYGTFDDIEPGELYMVAAGENNPEYIIINSNDIEKIKAMLPRRRLVHVREWVNPKYAKIVGSWKEIP